MATVGEVRKAWTVAKAAVGGVGKIQPHNTGGVRILPECVEVWGGGECVRIAVKLGAGPVAVDGHTLAALVKLGKPSDEITVEVDEGERVIVWNGAEARTINGSDLPPSPSGSPEWYGPYPGESVKGAAGFTANEMRPILTAVAFIGDEVVATDSYRLSRERIVGGRMPGDDPLLIPARPLAAIGAKCESVMIAVEDREARVSGDIPTGRGKPTVQVEWCGETVEGQYPKYDQITPDPEAYQVEACLYPERGIEAVEAAVASLDKSSRLARLTLNGEVEIATSTPEGITLPPAVMAGPARWTGDTPPEPMEVGINAGYLRDAVKYLDNDGGAVMLRVISPLRPVLMERKARNGRGERSVLTMPLRLAD